MAKEDITDSVENKPDTAALNEQRFAVKKTRMASGYISHLMESFLNVGQPLKAIKEFQFQLLGDYRKYEPTAAAVNFYAEAYVELMHHTDDLAEKHTYLNKILIDIRAMRSEYSIALTPRTQHIELRAMLYAYDKETEWGVKVQPFFDDMVKDGHFGWICRDTKRRLWCIDASGFTDPIESIFLLRYSFSRQIEFINQCKNHIRILCDKNKQHSEYGDRIPIVVALTDELSLWDPPLNAVVEVDKDKFTYLTIDSEQVTEWLNTRQNSNQSPFNI